jgi:PAS domain S-box-containing protein
MPLPGGLAGAGQPEKPHAPVRFDRRLRILNDTAFEALCVVDDERRYQRANRAAERVLGASRARILECRVDDFTLPEHLPELERLWHQLREEGTLEGLYLVAQGSGTLQPIRFRAHWAYGPGEHLIAGLEVPATSAPPRGVETLTPRERQILALAAEGRSNQEIARQLVLSPATVKTHLQNIYRKLDAPDRAAAVASALRAGLIS